MIIWAPTIKWHLYLLKETEFLILRKLKKIVGPHLNEVAWSTSAADAVVKR